ncbi:ABC-type bacteriocin/lantibiotic exporter with N-terminal double-glycine peptidase domain [Cryptosporangium arvum DSM 44712]|uniref:ABC-type bacteriocin/lantibiotic exporter with N-terminal double-glycine peptidase domain n=1 Tax=Cryptosporangium arvum DSM 44712 TaxID=927661 RepID=A0A010ZUL7_9ACTN|nr:ABC-type bacteriocin/lantibiotic exporter with N-terminal double-glycine peptidase domain [Cryptosporangium arvum DSM 44712]
MPPAAGPTAPDVSPRAAALMAVRIAWLASPRAVVLLAVSALVGAAAPVAVTWLTRAVIDQIVAGGPAGLLVGLATGVALAGVVTATLPQLDQYLQAELNRTASLTAIERLHGSVGRLIGLVRFEQPAFLDRLQMAVMSERGPADVVAGGLGAARSVLALVGFLVSLVVISPVMAVVVVVAAIPVLFAELALSRRRADMTFTISPNERRELFYRELLLRANAAKETRLFGIAGFLQRRMLTERRKADAARRAVDRRELAVQGGLALLGAAVAGGGLVWAVRAARQGDLSIGDIALFIGATAGVQSALSNAIGQFTLLHQKFLIFDHYRAVVTGPSDLPAVAHPRQAPPLREGIELRDVWFRYTPDAPWALRGVNLTIPVGRATALVGRNGSGKSTLIKLLCRFYDPERGAVYWDGVDLRDLDPASLRERVTAVFQDFVEYDLTAAENIGVGDVTAIDDEDRIRTAAQRAGVDDELAGLPAGYQTLLSRIFMTETDREDPTTGVVLSGGQWQRLAVARAFMRDGRDLMILDEPSSGMDAEAEYRIHAGLQRHRAGRTSVLISHRLGSIRNADAIAVMDDGVVVEEGTHADLMNTGGIYAHLFLLQATGYLEDQATVEAAP